MKTIRPLLAAFLVLASLLFVSCAGTNLTVTPDGIWVGWEKDSGVVVTVPQAVPVVDTTK